MSSNADAQCPEDPDCCTLLAEMRSIARTAVCDDKADDFSFQLLEPRRREAWSSNCRSREPTWLGTTVAVPEALQLGVSRAIITILN